MRFGKNQEIRFGTTNGAYSLVTDREHYDSQITLTDYEAELVVGHFGANNIHVGRVQLNPQTAAKPFRHYPDGTSIELNLVYPKEEKTELRLYISSKSGFKPEGGEIWFVFLRNGDIWIGSLTESEWRKEAADIKKDENDDLYQNTIYDPDPILTQKIKEREVYVRDRELAIKRMEMAGFSCEYDEEHKLFISRFSRKNYLEAHHLIPIGLQAKFTTALDSLDNIFCLCPYCHRAVHHAKKSKTRKILEKLAEKRPVLETYRLDIHDLFNLYAVEEIV